MLQLVPFHDMTWHETCVADFRVYVKTKGNWSTCLQIRVLVIYVKLSVTIMPHYLQQNVRVGGHGVNTYGNYEGNRKGAEAKEKGAYTDANTGKKTQVWRCAFVEL